MAPFANRRPHERIANTLQMGPFAQVRTMTRRSVRDLSHRRGACNTGEVGLVRGAQPLELLRANGPESPRLLPSSRGATPRAPARGTGLRVLAFSASLRSLRGSRPRRLGLDPARRLGSLPERTSSRARGLGLDGLQRRHVAPSGALTRSATSQSVGRCSASTSDAVGAMGRASPAPT